MFELLHDRKHNVLLTRLSGIYRLEDIVVRDRLVSRFVEEHGLARGVMDFSAVTRLGMPIETIVRRAAAPARLPGQAKLFVAKGSPGLPLCRVVAALQYFERGVETPIVDSLEEACRILAATPFDFRPLEQAQARARESDVLRFVARVDEANWREDEQLDALAQRTRRLRFDSAYFAEPASAALTDPAAMAISVADLLNCELHTRVDDGDLAVDCPGCGLGTTLAKCRVTVSRSTRYACPRCDAALVAVTPSSGSAIARGYPLGGFDVETWADLYCLKVLLPRSTSLDGSPREPRRGSPGGKLPRAR
ncbi:MAG: hypothetical protein ACOY4R_31505 [Pseudomonadota bacterium]